MLNLAELCYIQTLLQLKVTETEMFAMDFVLPILMFLGFPGSCPQTDLDTCSFVSHVTSTSLRSLS